MNASSSTFRSDQQTDFSSRSSQQIVILRLERLPYPSTDIKEYLDDQLRALGFLFKQSRRLGDHPASGMVIKYQAEPGTPERNFEEISVVLMVCRSFIAFTLELCREI